MFHVIYSIMPFTNLCNLSFKASFGSHFSLEISQLVCDIPGTSPEGPLRSQRPRPPENLQGTFRELKQKLMV